MPLVKSLPRRRMPPEGERPPRHGVKRAAPPAGPPPKRKRPNRPQLSGTATPHGSYKNYYARRLRGRAASSDDRLPLLRRVVTRLGSGGLALLDVGCNDGALTTALAATCPRVRAAVGVDVDAALVEKASEAVRARAAPLKAAASLGDGAASLAADTPAADSFIPLSCQVVQGARTGAGRAADGAKRVGQGDGSTSWKPVNPHSFPFNITFRSEDFAAEKAGRTAREHASYDVVLCLSVTKWVHLHGGDAALKRLFAHMRDCLRPGGVLVLEPQPKKSYKRARQKKMEGVNRTFKELELRPDQFKDYLLGAEGGFSSFEMLRDVRGEKGKDFNRPVMAFYKAKADGKAAEKKGNESDEEGVRPDDHQGERTGERKNGRQGGGGGG